MSWTYEQIVDALGEEAQPVPGAIMVYRGKHIIIAEVYGGGGFAITPEGAAILAALEPPKEAPKPRGRKAHVVVDTPAVVDPPDAEE